MCAANGNRDGATMIEIAGRLVEREGLDALTMDALAQAAGVSRATVYRRVGSRSQLLARLVEAETLAPEQIEQRDVPSRVLEAMQQVLEHEGLTGTTVERVAEAADVSPATIYRRFDDRDGLFAAYAKRYSPRRLASELAESGGDLEADLTAVARASLRFMRQHPALVRLRLSGDPEARRLLSASAGAQERMLHALARYFEQPCAAGRLAPADPFELAVAFGGLVTGFGLVAQDYDDTELGDLDATARQIVRLFLDGARGHGETNQGERSHDDIEPH